MWQLGPAGSPDTLHRCLCPASPAQQPGLLTHCSHLSSVSWVATTSRAPARVTRSTTQSWAERASLWPHLYTGKVLVTMSAPYTPGSSARSSSSSLMQQAVVSRRTSPRYLQSYMLHRAVHTHTGQSGLAGGGGGCEVETRTGYRYRICGSQAVLPHHTWSARAPSILLSLYTRSSTICTGIWFIFLTWFELP